MARGSGAKFMLLLMLILVAIYIVFIFFPSQKKTIPKPALAADQPIGVEHIDWVARQLGAAAVSNNPSTGRPAIVEIVVTPDDQRFNIVIDSGVITTAAGGADNPDVRVIGGREVVEELLSASDFIAAAKDLDSRDKIHVEAFRGTEFLEAMGYTQLYARYGRSA